MSIFRKASVVIILVQLIIIGCLIAFLIKTTFFSGIAVDPIKKAEIVEESKGDYKYFFEPVPNSSDPATLQKDRKIKAKYTINSDALNERYDYLPEKQKGNFRIITLGASFTQGLYVDTKDNWTEILENKLNKLSCKNFRKIEVINLGYRGYDNDYVVERYRRRGVKYNPDLVIWLQSPFLVPVEKVQMLTQEKMRKNYNPKEPVAVTEEKYSKTYIKASNEILKEMGGMEALVNYQKKAILNIGKFYHSSLILAAIHSMPVEQKKLLKSLVVNNKNWSYFDGMRKFSVFTTDWHPDGKGNQMIAEDIYSYLKNSKVFQCN